MSACTAVRKSQSARPRSSKMVIYIWKHKGWRKYKVRER